MFEDENLNAVNNALQEFERVEVDDLPENLQESAIRVHMQLMHLGDVLENELEDD